MSYRIEVDGVSHQIDRDDGGVVHAPAPAVVVSIAVKPGDTVAVGDRLAVLEAMKMEMQVVAPFSGKVRQVMTMPNVQVDTGAPLLQIEPAAADDTVADAERVVFGASRQLGREGDAAPIQLPPRAWKNSASSCWALTSIRSRPRGCSPNGARVALRTATKSDSAKMRSSTSLWTYVLCSSASRK